MFSVLASLAYCWSRLQEQTKFHELLEDQNFVTRPVREMARPWMVDDAVGFMGDMLAGQPAANPDCTPTQPDERLARRCLCRDVRPAIGERTPRMMVRTVPMPGSRSTSKAHRTGIRVLRN